MIKRSTLIFLTILISFLFLASIAKTQGGSISGALQAAAATVRNWANYLAGVAFGFCAILIATSGGNPGRLAQAKEALAYIAIGWVLVEFSSSFILPTGGGISGGLAKIVEGLGKVATIAGTIYLAYGIFEFATSGGNPAKLDEAKTAIMWGAIGIIVGGTTFTVTSSEAAKVEILKILGTAATAMGAVSVSLGIYKIATSLGDPAKLKEGITNIIWGAVGVTIGAIFLQGRSPFG